MAGRRRVLVSFAVLAKRSEHCGVLGIGLTCERTGLLTVEHRCRPLKQLGLDRTNLRVKNM